MLNRELKRRKDYDRILLGVVVYRVCWPFILNRWEVMRMDKKPFDFKDLMQFGMFILALLTFIYLISQ